MEWASRFNQKIFGTLFNVVADALFTIDVTSLRIISANAGLSELLGEAPTCFVGRPARELFIADERVDDWVDAIVARAGLYEEVALRRVDDYPVHVALTVAHVDADEHGMIVACVARDTSDRRKLERELISKHAALYSAHAELAVAFDELRATQKRLEDRNRELSVMGVRLADAAHRAAIGELSAGVAHSMNNPLGAAVSALRQVSRVVSTAGDQDLVGNLERYLKRARRALSRMESIVDTVRRAHRCGNISSTAKRVAIADEIGITMALFEGRMGETTIEYCITPSLTGYLPPDALHHVFANLIDNAVAIMAGEGCMTISLVGRDDDVVVLSVEDTAGGVPEEIRNTMFEPFVTKREGGTGLGLCMAQRLARGWGGDVIYEPTAEGSRFGILIPKEKIDASTPDSHRRR